MGWTVALTVMMAGTAGAGAGPGPAAPPAFGRHIMPIFSRAGCNSGSCHGTFAGKNGFHLSLFGYQPIDDHQRITRAVLGRRIDLTDPPNSLLLLKATGQMAHGGG